MKGIQSNLDYRLIGDNHFLSPFLFQKLAKEIKFTKIPGPETNSRYNHIFIQINIDLKAYQKEILGVFMNFYYPTKFSINLNSSGENLSVFSGKSYHGPEFLLSDNMNQSLERNPRSGIYGNYQNHDMRSIKLNLLEFSYSLKSLTVVSNTRNLFNFQILSDNFVRKSLSFTLNQKLEDFRISGSKKNPKWVDKKSSLTAYFSILCLPLSKDPSRPEISLLSFEVHNSFKKIIRINPKKYFSSETFEKDPRTFFGKEIYLSWKHYDWMCHFLLVQLTTVGELLHLSLVLDPLSSEYFYLTNYFRNENLNLFEEKVPTTKKGMDKNLYFSFRENFKLFGILQFFKTRNFKCRWRFSSLYKKWPTIANSYSTSSYFFFRKFVSSFFIPRNSTRNKLLLEKSTGQTLKNNFCIQELPNNFLSVILDLKFRFSKVNIGQTVEYYSI